VLLNAAAAFIVADKVETLKAGVKMAEAAIDSGKARQTLAKLVAVSNG
jgi:anthranilate phosphoribosyltransferase